MSQLSEFFKHTVGSAMGRAIHVPEGDMPDFQAAVNDARQNPTYQLTESDIRAIEHVQAVYIAGHMVHQLLPRQLQPVAGVVAAGVQQAVADATTSAQPQPDLPIPVAPVPPQLPMTGGA